MRIGIVGTGAMASIFGDGLIESGHDVVFFGRTPATVAALNGLGLTVEREGAPSRHHAVTATTETASAGIFEIVFVLVKSYDTESAARSLAPIVGPKTVIVTLQNGIGAAEIIGAEFPESMVNGYIVQGVTYQGGTIKGPGHVYHHSTGTTVFGPYRGEAITKTGEAPPRRTKSTSVDKVVALWSRAGWSASATTAINAEIWKKVVVNGVNALAAVTELPSRAMAESPPVRQLIETVVLEGMAVAHGLGYRQLDPKQAVADILRVLAETPEGRTSMLQDVEAGRRTEIDVLNGAVIAAAKRLGVNVPVTEGLYTRVVDWEIARGLRPAPVETVETNVAVEGAVN